MMERDISENILLCICRNQFQDLLNIKGESAGVDVPPVKEGGAGQVWFEVVVPDEDFIVDDDTIDEWLKLIQVRYS